MKNTIAVILACLVCFTFIAFSACKKRAPIKLALRSAENDNPAINLDNFSGTGMDEFAASMKEIKTRDDEYMVYSAMYDKIISDDIGIFIPEDEERITYLGIQCYQPFSGCGLSLNEDGIVDSIEIKARCIFTCDGIEYEASFYTYGSDGLSENSTAKAKTFELADRKIEFIFSDVLGEKCVHSCSFKVGNDIVVIMPVKGNFFENTEFTDLPEDIFEFLEIFNLKKVSLKDLIE